MPATAAKSDVLRSMRMGMACLALFQFTGATSLFAQQGSGDGYTTTPIKHVIVIIGENRSFDHVFATYVPRGGQSVWNLLSEGIVNADGTPGLIFGRGSRVPPRTSRRTHSC